MNKFQLGFNIIKALATIVPFVESLFKDEPKSGVLKKKLATEALKSIVTAGESVATGGGKDTWDKIESHSSDLIDMTAGLFYPPNK